jgi:hypothetical protein
VIRTCLGKAREGRRGWPRRLLQLYLCVLASLATAGASHASGEHRVVLLRPSAPDELTTMALARIKGELIAAGFEVTLLPQREDMAARNAVETVALELKPLAVFAIFHDEAKAGMPWVAEIWVSDRVVDRTSVERMRLDSAEPGRGATVLAVRAVELLKASLAEFWTAPAERPRPPPSPVVLPRLPAERPAPVPIVRRPTVGEGVAAQAAFGMLYSFGEIGPVWTPLLALSYGTPQGVGARLTVGGLGSSAIVETAEGTGRIEQQFATIEGFVMSRWQGSLQVFVSGGVGAYRAQVEGTGVYPYRGKTAEGWSLLTGAGIGIAAEVYPHIALIAEAEGYWAWPSAVVRVAHADAGRPYWPLLLARTGIGIGF